MPARRRHGSTSSVETIDSAAIRWRQEASVVKKVPADVSPDSWPIFELKDAAVYSADGQTLQNALELGTKGPFIVRGHLVIDEREQKSHLLMRIRSSMPLEIRHCVSYSMGESDDGSPIIWVSGRGGWYEINPSAAYQSVYNKMCQATTLYYTFMDTYNLGMPKKSRKSKGSIPNAPDDLSHLFLQYAVQIGDGSTYHEVERRCLEHAPFLLWQCTQESPGTFDWSSTGFYKWLISERKDLYENAQALIKNPRPMPRLSADIHSPAPSSPAIPLRSRAKSAASGSDTATSVRMQRSAQSNSTAVEESTTSSPAAAGGSSIDSDIDMSAPEAMPDVPGDTVDTALASVVEAIESAHRQLSSSKTGQTASAIVNKIYFSYKFPNYRDGTTGCHRVPVQEVLHYNSKALLQVLDRSKYENHDILGYLEQLAKTKFSPIAIKMSDFPYPLIHRKQMVRNSKKPVLERSSDVSVTSEEATSGQPIRQARGGKQVKTRAGKKSGLRLPTSSAKRPHADLESGSESENSAAKKSHFFSEDDGVEDAADTSAEGGEDTSDNGERPSTDPVKIFIRAEKIPSSVPRGLHDTWTCEQQGCDYIVRGGEEEECQDRIREHFRDHEESKRVDLAVTESRGLLPINHLLEKIKSLGERSQQDEQLFVNGASVPQPIKRKLLV